jgi:hypothetical protein
LRAGLKLGIQQWWRPEAFEAVADVRRQWRQKDGRWASRHECGSIQGSVSAARS